MFQPLFARPLTDAERETLEVTARSAKKEEAHRADAILQSASGKTAAEISQALRHHPSNIKKWIRSFNKDGLGGVAPKKRGPQGGPRPNFTRAQTEAILELARSSPLEHGYSFKQWTPQKLATAATALGVVSRISHVTVRQLLKRAEFAGARASDSLPLKPTASDNAREVAGRNFVLGKKALDESQYETAVTCLSLALSREADTHESEAQIRCLLTQALEELSRYQEALDLLSQYEDPQTLSRLSPRTRARIKQRVGMANSYLRNYSDAIAALNEAMKTFAELKDNMGMCETYYALGRTYIQISEFRIARDHLFAAINYQKPTANRELLALIYDRLGTADLSEGEFTSARDYYLKALELVQDSRNVNLIGMILVNVGTTIDEGYQGSRDEAAGHLYRATQYLEKGGRKDYLATAYNNLGDILRRSGRWDEAIACVKKGIDIAQQFAHPSYEATARITLAELLCARGKYEEAETHVKRSLDLTEGGTDRWADKWLESSALRVLSRIHWGTGRIESSLDILRNTLQLSTSIGDLLGVTLAQIALAELHYWQGGYGQAREYLQLAQARLKEEKSLLASGLIQRLMGQIEATSSRLAEAKQCIAQSISIFTTTEIVYELARSCYEMAVLLRRVGDSSAAEANFVQAREIFEKLGAEPDLALTTKALAALATGGKRERGIVRVTPPSDVLLMQRLIEATASRDLLLQEFANVVFENFTVTGLALRRADDGDNSEPLIHIGLSREEASRISRGTDVSITEPIVRVGDVYLVRIGNGSRTAVLMALRASDSIDIERLRPLIKQAELGLEVCSLRATSRREDYVGVEQRVQVVMPGFIVASRSMFDVLDKIHKIRTSDVTVLITGESGTGKELVARALHAESARARAIFLPFNCTATPKDLFDSQLFGHRRGAFTGATANYPGIIKAADGGTLFLDEIGDLSLEVQPKLMRFLQESEIQPLGEVKPIRVDVRVLAATNSDLERAVDDGRFREDLFHRLNIIRIHVPPLRQRREEVPVLADHFLGHFASRSGKHDVTLSEDAIEALTAYSWSGNVRQLRNEIERVVAYASDGARIESEDLSPEVAHPHKTAAPPGSEVERRGMVVGDTGVPVESGNGDGGHRSASVASGVKLKEATAALETQLIQEALVRNRNNLSRTALDLGLSRRGLRLKLAQLGIQKDEHGYKVAAAVDANAR
ncbi:MAG TPA: sigma 54-interacting transcriptional regulator [Blastocatellia bacterium]|nr:sigma 54-interacting transcriptional regulator [Blastocatellia bacterium]